MARELKRIYYMIFKKHHVTNARVSRQDLCCPQAANTDYLFSSIIHQPKNVQAVNLKDIPKHPSKPGGVSDTPAVQKPNRIIHCLSKLFKKRCCQ